MSRKYPTSITLADGRTYDATIPDAQQQILRMMVAADYPGAWSRAVSDPGPGYSKFGDVIDPLTLRATVLAHRHTDTGVWVLRVDGLERTSPTPRQKPHFGTPEYNALLPRERFTFFSSDYGGLTDLVCRWREDLVPVALVHYARQVERLAPAWAAKRAAERSTQEDTRNVPS